MNRPTEKDPRHCSEALQISLMEYVDGELPFADQPALFAHLTVCGECRLTLDGILAFRRIVREEFLAVPPSVDDAFLRRLNARQQAASVGPRPGEGASSPGGLVSIRTLVMVALVVFLIGLLTPATVSSDDAPPGWVEMREERVQWRGETERGQAVYVFYPGVTIEAPRHER